MPEISLTPRSVAVCWVVNSDDAGYERMSQPLIPISKLVAFRAQVTGVPGGAVIWNFIVAVVSPPVVSYATHSIPVVGSVHITQVTHEKKAVRERIAMTHTERGDVEPP